jgi:hypothetical protein
MNRYADEPSRQTAKMNRERLAPQQRPAILEEIDKKTADARINMARLREERLAKEAQEVRSKIATSAKPKPRRRFR